MCNKSEKGITEQCLHLDSSNRSYKASSWYDVISSLVHVSLPHTHARTRAHTQTERYLYYSHNCSEPVLHGERLTSFHSTHKLICPYNSESWQTTAMLSQVKTLTLIVIQVLPKYDKHMTTPLKVTEAYYLHDWI